MSENKYKKIIIDYLEDNLKAEKFIENFMIQWKKDRDIQKEYDSKFQRLIDRIFTSCDCYCENTENDYEIDENELRKEVKLLNHIWFG